MKLPRSIEYVGKDSFNAGVYLVSQNDPRIPPGLEAWQGPNMLADLATVLWPCLRPEEADGST